MLTKVNAEENEITIKEETQAFHYTIIVPKSLLVEIIRKYWSRKILISVRQTPYGVMVLENIQAAG